MFLESDTELQVDSCELVVTSVLLLSVDGLLWWWPYGEPSVFQGHSLTLKDS